ncbi:hypothetical protein GGR54DRAFT_449360 [Hypoxylon sp. NC1633]|nr:hypothetical protein GGR54DRAFT_449360 [Hypoxylon sp. NC1633]
MAPSRALAAKLVILASSLPASYIVGRNGQLFILRYGTSTYIRLASPHPAPYNNAWYCRLWCMHCSLSFPQSFSDGLQQGVKVHASPLSGSQLSVCVCFCVCAYGVGQAARQQTRNGVAAAQHT